MGKISLAGNRPPQDRRRPASQRSWIGFIPYILAAVLTIYVFARLLIELLRRFRRRPSGYILLPEPVPAKPPVSPPPTPAPAPTLEVEEAPPAAPEVTFGIPVEEAEPPVSYEIFQPAAPALPLPDLYFTVPPEVQIESFEPQYQFNWQNPTLLQSIYPFRKEKLVDFLAFFTEIELCKKYRAKRLDDPDIQNKIRRTEAALLKTRQEVTGRLRSLLEARKLTDPYLARISGANEKNLRFKQKYYLDREIQRLEDKLDQLEDQKTTFLKRLDWYTAEDPRREIWRSRAGALDPQIEQLRAELAEARDFRNLFDQEAQLPSLDAGQASVEDVVRWEIREKREQWQNKDEVALLAEIITDWFQRDPDRFPEWLVYMVIHFSGMRYMSSHGSWAEPRYLLELLTREDLENEIEAYDSNRLASACSRVLQELQRETGLPANDPKQKYRLQMSQRLQNGAVRKRALLEYCTARAIEEIQRLPDDNACLTRLVQYKQEKDASDDPLPTWVWSEIVKYTPLRLQTSDPDWEAHSRERWRGTNAYWQAILNTWERKDITSWRQKHRETLELVVTRAVCNEIAEHIQHLRGLSPAAGLTAKPVWYLRQAAKDPQRAYFKQAPAEEDFRSGASILWLDWVDKQPNAWQVARPLPGFSFIPGQGGSPPPGRKGEVRKKDLDLDLDGRGWNHQRVGGAFIRTRLKAPVQGLKKQGKPGKEIQSILADRRITGGVDKQYLRWRHEATVIDVVDMADGRYVLTFETGKIGVILRRLSDLRGNPMVFVGYVPDAPDLPPELDRRLVEMLRWDRILPEDGLPARVRPHRQAVPMPG